MVSFNSQNNKVFTLTEPCKSLEINQQSKQHKILVEVWLHVKLFVVGFLTLQMPTKSSSSRKPSVVPTTNFLVSFPISIKDLLYRQDCSFYIMHIVF